MYKLISHGGRKMKDKDQVTAFALRAGYVFAIPEPEHDERTVKQALLDVKIERYFRKGQ